jgi:hypothetical protein
MNGFPSNTKSPLPLFSQSLMSLWDMNRLFVPSLINVNYAIEHFVKVCEMKEWTPSKKAAIRKSLENSIPEIDLLCPPGAKEAFMRTISRIDSMLLYDATHASIELRNRFSDDTKTVFFLHIPANQIELYNGKEQFGPVVAKRFSCVSNDIEEAAKCLALDRGTACVFHLMRVVESGLDAMAKRLRIARQNNWGNYLSQIRDRLDEKKGPLPLWVKRNKSFFKDSAMVIALVKDKWRNPCVHRINKHYSPQQAEEVFESVKKLMQQLATKLKQRRRKAAYS